MVDCLTFYFQRFVYRNSIIGRRDGAVATVLQDNKIVPRLIQELQCYIPIAQPFQSDGMPEVRSREAFSTNMEFPTTATHWAFHSILLNPQRVHWRNISVD
jgi:hypothetical protein